MLIQQEKHTEDNALVGMIENYLTRLLPTNWYDRNIPARRAFIHDRGDFGVEQLKDYALTRTRVCALEIWVELLEGDPKNLQPIMSRNIGEALRKIKGWRPVGTRRFSQPYGNQKSYEKENLE